MGTAVLEEAMSMDELNWVDVLPFKRNVTADHDWRATIDRVVPAVVVIRTTVPRAFDTEAPGCYNATGFVVDKRRGIILTNRHVVQTGPVVAEEIFMNREEIPICPIYRDPVHDFGFFRYDPSAIQFLSYEEIPLAPEMASVGLEIRVVGNDSGEKVSIVTSTLARLDREAPEYDRNGYNDFNTFYLQAASGTKGGSSGSPVIDCQGRSVALNAGGSTNTGSAFFLPLERVVRALKFLQSGRDSSINGWEAVNIPRGTLQVTFLHKGFEETRRLGVRSETEQLVRHASPPAETGMLVVQSAVPYGPANSRLEQGDVLVRLNGKVTTQFLSVEDLLDQSVNCKVELQIERRGKPLTVELTVQDLHSVTPDRFLEISGTVIHPLSYQQARNFRLPCGLAYVAEQGFLLFKAGVPGHAIITKFAGEDISRVEDFIFELSRLTRGARVPLEYVCVDDRHQIKSALVTFDRHEWYGPPQIYTRNDRYGLWHVMPALPPNSPLLSSRLANGVSPSCSEVTPVLNSNVNTCKWLVQEPPFIDESIKRTTIGKVMEEKLKDLGDWRGIANGVVNTSTAERVVEPALVRVEVHVPWSCNIDGVHKGHFSGTGVIIYHSLSMGLVVIDRNTVPISVCDVMLSFFAYPVEIHGEVVFLHPTHNFALVAYDPSALGVGASLVRAAELLPEPVLRRGDTVYLVGLSLNQQVTSMKSIIMNASAINIRSAENPRFRATNNELIELHNGSKCTGVLTDKRGRVRAIW